MIFLFDTWKSWQCKVVLQIKISFEDFNVMNNRESLKSRLIVIPLIWRKTKMKRFFFKEIIFTIIGIILGVILTTYHFMGALRLLTEIKIVEGYTEMENAYRSQNKDIIFWEAEQFDKLLSNTPEYKTISPKSYYYYSFIANALLFEFSDCATTKEQQKYQKMMIRYFDLLTNTDEPQTQRPNMEEFLKKVLEKLDSNSVSPVK